MNTDELHERFGVTTGQLDAWADEYETGDWSHMRFGDIVQGRPRISVEPLELVSVKVPHSRVVALKKLADESGITKSELVRRAIDNELVSLA